MFEELFTQIKLSPEEIINQGVLTGQAFDEIKKFYQRIENRLNEPSFVQKRGHYAYDHVITHSRQVTFYSVVVARAAGFTVKACCEMAVASILHDLDKLYWPTTLLDKPKNELSRADWTRIMEHAVASAIFVERLTRHQISPMVITIIKQHHENLDGTGYPHNLTGKDIGPATRIIRITDSYESMVFLRPYKKRVLSHEEALNDLKNKTVRIYDSDIIKIFEQEFSAGKNELGV